MRKLIKSLLKKYGYTIRLYDEYEEKLEPVKNKWLKNESIHTILDVGASFGQYAKKIRSVFPEAEIISFEALPDSFEILNNNFKDDKNFTAHNVALSNFEGETVFRKSSNTGSSSLLVMEELHKTNYPHSKENSEMTVKCNTLDAVLKNKNLKKNILLKLDVQGAEKLVLEGATETLKQVQIIFSEINFNSLYKDSVLFNELTMFLHQHHFKVEGIENVSQSLIDGTYLQADVYFKRIED